MNDIYKKYPCIRIFPEYSEARNYQIEKNQKIAQQNERLDSIFEGKIVSDVVLYELTDLSQISINGIIRKFAANIDEPKTRK